MSLTCIPISSACVLYYPVLYVFPCPFIRVLSIFYVYICAFIFYPPLFCISVLHNIHVLYIPTLFILISYICLLFFRFLVLILCIYTQYILIPYFLPYSPYLYFPFMYCPYSCSVHSLPPSFYVFKFHLLIPSICLIYLYLQQLCLLSIHLLSMFHSI